jgi:hypothetical protein
MGRKTIPPNQRAQPISFSLKPHLIEKIDDYAHDLRFSRSKFLMQAVTEYMTRHIVHGLESSSNVDDMSIDRRVAVGLAALQEANREGHLINKGVMEALRRELGVVEGETPEETAILDAAFADYNEGAHIEYYRTRAGRYEIYTSGRRSGTIEKYGGVWILNTTTDSGAHESNHRTLAGAKDYFEESV